MARFRIVLPALAAGLLLLSACGSSDTGNVTPPTGEESSSIEAVIPSAEGTPEVIAPEGTGEAVSAGAEASSEEATATSSVAPEAAGTSSAAALQ